MAQQANRSSNFDRAGRGDQREGDEDEEREGPTGKLTKLAAPPVELLNRGRHCDTGVASLPYLSTQKKFHDVLGVQLLQVR
eukprot:489275-Hanusia_phi.AAC.1